MMPSITRAMEQTIARMHIFFRDFCCMNKAETGGLSAGNSLQWQHWARLRHTHLVVTGSLELLCSSFYMDFSALHIGLDAVCRVEHRTRSAESKQLWTSVNTIFILSNFSTQGDQVHHLNIKGWNKFSSLQTMTGMPVPHITLPSLSVRSEQWLRLLSNLHYLKSRDNVIFSR